jgi:glycosyltransferase involved in cell wall biosynthesis
VTTWGEVYNFGEIMSKKKILFQLNQLGYGGTEKAILSLAKAMDRTQFDLYLFVQDQRGSARYYRHKLEALFSKRAAKRFQSIYIDRYVRESAFRACFGDDHIFFGQLPELKATLEKIQPDILHLNRGEVHDFYTDFVSHLEPKIHVIETSIFGKSSTSEYLERVNLFLFISQWLRQKSPWAEPRSDILFNPIETPISKQNLRSELGIPSNAVVLGRVGRPDLGDDQFISSVLSEVYQQPENTKNPLFFISMGVKAPELPSSISAAQHKVISLQPTTDANRLSSFYNTIDILLHRRVEGETFGMINAEAMMHGKVVVSHLSNVDNAQVEILGDTGLISELQDFKTYAGFVSRLIQNPSLREELGKKAAQRSWDLFRPEVVAKRLHSIYNRF